MTLSTVNAIINYMKITEINMKIWWKSYQTSDLITFYVEKSDTV